MNADTAGCERRARIEAEPAEPQDARTQQRHGEVVRRNLRRTVTEASSKHDGGDQCSRSAGGMYHDAARKILDAHRCHPTAAPHPMCHRGIDHQNPEHTEECPCAELHAFCEGAGDERGRDHCEHALVDGECTGRNRASDLTQDPGEAEMFQSADEPAEWPGGRTERQGVAGEYPDNRDDACGEHALHDRGQYVLCAHHAAVEQRQPRSHEQHE
jgi:hypothetical protein